jgi:hypothetical protein
VAGKLANVRLAVLSLWALLACRSPISDAPLEIRTVAATVEAWAAAELPDPTERCYLERFDVVFPKTEADYYRLCYGPQKSHACFRELLQQHPAMGLFSRVVPTAVIRPGETAVEALAVHELAHWLYRCTGLGTVTDPYDAQHSDPAVWGPGPAVETHARNLLE